MTLLQMSMQGAVLSAVIAALRAVAKHRIPKRVFPYLWAVVLARLLVPISVPSPWSAYSLAERAPVLRERLPATVLHTAAHTPSGPVRQATPSVWWVLWAIGAAALAAYFLLGYLHFWRNFRFALPIQDEFAQCWLAEHPILRRVQLRQTGCIPAPLTYGIMRPVILLPKSFDLSRHEELQYILAHEMTHIRHFDTLWKLISTIALCLHWFNPFVWLLCALLGRDLELACDESVIQQFGAPSRQGYARTLLRLEEYKIYKIPFSSHFSQTPTEERILAIMKLKKTSFAALLTVLLLVIGTVAVFATSSKPESKMLSGDAAKLELLRFLNYEKMTVADFRERVNQILDKPDMQNWFNNVQGNDEYYDLQDSDYLCEFLYHIVCELTGERWQAREHGGAAVSEIPLPFTEPIMVEYTFRLDILDPKRLTVSEYHAAMHGVWNDIDRMMQALSAEKLLSGQSYLEDEITAKIKEICDKWSSNSLQVNMTSLVISGCDSIAHEIEDILSNNPFYPQNSALGSSSNTDLKGYTEQASNGESIHYSGNTIRGTQSSADLSEYQEIGSSDDLTGYLEPETEQRRYPPATKADYDSLLRLKTPDYSSLTLEKFNKTLLDWMDADYERMERVGSDTSTNTFSVPLTEEEREFVTLTVQASGAENGAKIRSLHTGRPEDPSFGSASISRSQSENGQNAFFDFYYQYSYHISDNSKVTVGERNQCVSGFLRAVDSFWQDTPFNDLMQLTKPEVTTRLQQLAAANSTAGVQLSVRADAVGWSTIDERSVALD